MPGERKRRYGEFDCLSLTISAPKDALGSVDGKNPLPVMVYVHGGGFKVGAGHVSALHDTTRLVDLSIREGHPVVIVNISYRLNWQGFLACQDLLSEAAANNEPPANFGLYDQRTAFYWVKRFIAGFGGDPTRITAFGESAGSGSLALHLSTSVPLFNRAMLMSGTTATGPPVDLNYKEAEYQALLTYCGIGVDDPERLKRLREVPVEKLIEAVDGLGVPLFNSLKSAEFYTRGFPTWYNEGELIGKCEWVDAVVLGDAFFEGWLFADAMRFVPLDGLITHTNNIFGTADGTKLLSTYGITTGMDHNTFWTKLLFLVGDVAFSEPTHKLSISLANNPSKKVYRYHMTMRNPFPGSNLHQIPGHHFIDMLFLFQTLRERYPTQRYRDLSEEFGKRWLRFGAGEAPWKEYKVDGTEDDEKIMIISGSAGWVIKSRKKDEVESKDAEEGERRYTGWETLSGALNALAKGTDGETKVEEARLAWSAGVNILKWYGVGSFSNAVQP